MSYPFVPFAFQECSLILHPHSLVGITDAIRSQVGGQRGAEGLETEGCEVIEIPDRPTGRLGKGRIIWRGEEKGIGTRKDIAVDPPFFCAYPQNSTTEYFHMDH